MSHRNRVIEARDRALHLINELEQLDPDRRHLLAQAKHLVIEATNQTLHRIERTTK